MASGSAARGGIDGVTDIIADTCEHDFDGVITVSEEDAVYAREIYQLPNVLGAVPTGVDFSYFADESKDLEPGEGFTLGFLGSMDWMPNIEGVHWFVREAWSSIKDKLPGCRLLIIGRKPPGSVKKLAEEDSQIVASSPSY